MADILSAYAADAWTCAKAADPAWVSAVAATIGALVASGLVFRWWLLRQDLRGSGAAIIALLGENNLEALPDLRTEGRYPGLIGHSSKVVYFEIGTDSYLLCRRDLDRLHAMGYVYRKERGYHLSRLGRLLLDRHDNARLLAKGVARAKRNRYLRCRGGLWLRCRCEKYSIAGHEWFPSGQNTRKPSGSAVCTLPKVRLNPPSRSDTYSSSAEGVAMASCPKIQTNSRSAIPKTCKQAIVTENANGVKI